VKLANEGFYNGTRREAILIARIAIPAMMGKVVLDTIFRLNLMSKGILTELLLWLEVRILIVPEVSFIFAWATNQI